MSNYSTSFDSKHLTEGKVFGSSGVPFAHQVSVKTGRRKSRWAWLLIFVAVVAAVYLAVIHPFPYVIEMPGPTINLLANTQIDGKTRPIVEVSDGKNHPTSQVPGQLRLVTVSMRGGPSTAAVRGWELISAYFDPSQNILPYSQVFPEDVSAEEERKVQKQFMTSSQDNARAAALTALEIPFSSKITIAGVSEKSDGYGKLKENDVLVAISHNGVEQQITSTADLYRILDSTEPGTQIKVSVKRGSQLETIEMKTIAPGEEGRKGSLLGAFINADYHFPYPISVNIPESIGGPSAGTVFALTMMNTISGGELIGNDSVAVTGTMSPNGMVGPIGGVVQKIYGAQHDGAKWFLAPDYNCDQLKDAKLPEGITPVRITNLGQAADVLRAIKSGQTDKLEVCPHK
ncbi:YlbL family protein [Boudabousia marimammalium]|uniref:YlbL family protein n=1 Tax=Boudabousia marimammalium TaxID=156892 RepID=UPI0013012329|nr:S16 family serine protease [Boudabousia marimammalium]